MWQLLAAPNRGLTRSQLAPTFKRCVIIIRMVLFLPISARTRSACSRKAINMLDADALEIHVNAAQEVVMPEGDRDFLWQEKYPYHCSNCFGSGLWLRK